MKQAKIFYFTVQDEQTKAEKLDWFKRVKFEKIPFEQITPDQKANWINLTDNDFDSSLPLIDKEVKAGRSQQAVFQLFSACNAGFIVRQPPSALKQCRLQMPDTVEHQG